ncbi:MAG: HEAT repeat domain-containing protein [Acidimicrobiia bacterium]|nr:HEAT repeat domain-containing protein [Acidimicrobiia bacterium]
MSQRLDLVQILDNPEPVLAAADPEVRRIAVGAITNHPHLLPCAIEMLRNDPEPSVRRECAEVAGRLGAAPVAALEDALGDPSPEVREAATTALGETAGPESVAKLIALARDDEEDRLVREAAVASLGAIADERARPVLLALIESAPPQIRRRCVPALSVFDGKDIEKALRAAANDRNPMVREAAEMVVGRQRD